MIAEVMVAALSHENGNTQLLPEESYFHRLALRAIRQLMNDNADVAEVSLDARAGMPDVTASDESLLQYHQPDDRMKEENLIPDSASRTPEEMFASEEMVAQLDIVLHGVGAKTARRSYFSRWKVSRSKRLPVFLTVKTTMYASPSITLGSEYRRPCRSAMTSASGCSSVPAWPDPAPGLRRDHSQAHGPFPVMNK